MGWFWILESSNIEDHIMCLETSSSCGRPNSKSPRWQMLDHPNCKPPIFNKNEKYAKFKMGNVKIHQTSLPIPRPQQASGVDGISSTRTSPEEPLRLKEAVATSSTKVCRASLGREMLWVKFRYRDDSGWNVGFTDIIYIYIYKYINASWWKLKPRTKQMTWPLHSCSQTTSRNSKELQVSQVAGWVGGKHQMFTHLDQNTQ